MELALHNAKQAGVDARIQVVQRDVRDFSIPVEKGVVICNPPYGERLLDLKAAQEIYRTMGKVFCQGHPHRYYVISPDMEFERSYGKTADKRRKLYNGMIPCQLYMYYNAPKFENRPAKPMPKSGFDGKRITLHYEENEE